MEDIWSALTLTNEMGVVLFSTLNLPFHEHHFLTSMQESLLCCICHRNTLMHSPWQACQDTIDIKEGGII